VDLQIAGREISTPLAHAAGWLLPVFRLARALRRGAKQDGAIGVVDPVGGRFPAASSTGYDARLGLAWTLMRDGARVLRVIFARPLSSGVAAFSFSPVMSASSALARWGATRACRQISAWSRLSGFA